MASPHVQSRPLTLPLISPASPLAKSTGRNSVESPSNPTAAPSPRTPNPQPQPHIRSMLDLPTSSPNKPSTPQQQNGSARPANIGATPSNDATSTGSAPAQPISTSRSTPVARTRPMSTTNLFSLTTAAMNADTSRSIARPTPPEKPPPTQRRLSAKDTNGKTNGVVVASPPSPTKDQKPKFSRVRSFMRRSSSSAKNDGTAPVTQTDGVSESLQSKETASTTKSTNIFTFSSRSSATSRSTTPPSPGSPASTINEAESESSLPEESQLAPRHVHSQSFSNLAKGGPRIGITWGPGVAFARPGPQRRRSVSTENVRSAKKTAEMKGIEEEREPKLKLQLAFSRDAREGTGLKARRLSACLPDEFWVDYCELDKEFKSSTVMPGRRGKLLGKGATSIVRLMCRKGDPKGIFYAVKEFRGKERDEDADDYVKKVKSEYSIAKSLHHPNIVETVRLCTHAGRWNHVMEYCAHGELFTMVEKGYFRPGGPFKLSDRQCFFKQMVRGVDYLHSHGIAHRDIKLENLLLTSEGYLKITDFGVSEVFCGEHPGLRASGGECGKNMKELRRCAPGICGSLPYIAPEVLEKKGDYDPRPLDVWSCAMVYLTMTYGGSPWQAAKTGNGYYNDFLAGWQRFLTTHPDGLIGDGTSGTPTCGRIFNAERIGSPALKRLMLKMLHPIPEKRMTIREVLVGPTVRGIECCSAETFEENTCCIDAKSGKTNGKIAAKKVLHSHVPPKDHKTPKIFQHRFDMGSGYS